MQISLSVAVRRNGGGERWASAGSEGDARKSFATREARASRRTTPALAGPVEPLVYTREQAAQALGVSLATLDRRVVPAIATVKTEWGARLLPAVELERYLAERREAPQIQQWRAERSGRRSALAPEVVARIRREHARGATLGEIARRLNNDGIPTGQGGRQWWPSTVRAVLARSESAAADNG